MENQFSRKLAGAIVILAVLLLMPTSVSAQDSGSPYSVYVDDELVQFDTPPIADRNHLLVEFRSIFELLGYQVEWDARTNTAYGFNHEQHIAFPIGQAVAIVNGEVKTLPVHTRVVNGRTMIPLRFVSEEAGYEVVWDESASSVYIKSGFADTEGFSVASTISLNGYVQLNGTVNERVRMVRLDIMNIDVPSETRKIYLEPMDGQIDALVPLPYGKGMYTMRIFTSNGTDRYGAFRLADTIKVVYPENTDLIVVPLNEDQHRYKVMMRLSPETEQAVLKITKLDREAHMKINLQDIDSQGIYEEEVYLAFGPGVYDVKLFEWYGGNQQIKSTTFTHEGNAGIELDKEQTDNSLLHVRGIVSPDMQWMWIQYANMTNSLIRHAFVPVVDGKVNQPLHLNLGEGQYLIKIEFGQDGPYNTGYVTSETFYADNLDTRNRYLIPSETVQSGERSIIELVSRITEGLSSDKDRSLAIHDWVATHIALDAAKYLADEEQDETAVAVLTDRVTSGKGFARLNAALHRAAGIPAKIVSGEVLIGDTWVDHTWNEVYLDGQWVIQDTARDAGIWDLEHGVFVPELSHVYFNPAVELFTSDHKKVIDLAE
jgi:hypothetical protein